MKSYVQYLSGLYNAIRKDIVAMFPDLSLSLERDYSRLLDNSKYRGENFFLLDLPAFGKHFEACLASGRLTQSNLPCWGGTRQRKHIPRLFSGLLLRVFEPNGRLRSQPCEHTILALRVLYLASKKVRRACSDSKVLNATKEFFEVESSLRTPSYNWDSDSLGNWLPETSFEDFVQSGNSDCSDGNQLSFGFGDIPQRLRIGEDRRRPLGNLQLVCNTLVSSMPKLDIFRLNPRHGPGAVSERLKKGVGKYSFPNWPRKLESLFPFDWFAVANWSHMEGDVGGDGNYGAVKHHEPPSRLLAVPKTAKAPRLIAAEPVAHQWIQQGLLDFLQKAISKTCLRNTINLNDQSYNGNLALISSLTRSHATIDLSSASDRLSCAVVERAFKARFDLMESFHACRTRWIENTVHKQLPRYSRIRKFAAQGSALTFPVQSIVFAMIAISSVITVRGWDPRRDITRASKEVLVFGDDMIVPLDAAQETIKVLTDLGLKVNGSKTFLTGSFRESCGVDAYNGVDVTPAYVLEAYKEAKPESIASTVECSNNFYTKGFWHAAQYLQSTLPQKVLRSIPVVPVGSGAFGFISYSGASFGHLRRRWNEALHCWERRAFQLSSRAGRTQTRGSHHLLQFFTECPGPTVKWASGIGERPRTIARPRWVGEDQLTAKAA